MNKLLIEDIRALPEQKPSLRLLAVRPVTIQARWDLRLATERFYGESVGLGEPGVHLEPGGTVLLVFRNDGPDLLVRLTDRPEVWVNKPRLIVESADLEAVRRRLDTCRIEYQPMQSLHGADQRIGLWDPSGNRLEIKRLWKTG